ncbi:MAG TPA: methyl-accepting chemotaxis protein [Alkalispirochaeta sp.]|nr:methyl-accepting chemotaxis protein [Alkalispirochaeta sp.]
MRLRTRLMIAFQSLAAIILIAGGIGVWQITVLNRAASQVSDVSTPHLYAIQKSQNAAIRANLTLTSIAAGFLRESEIARVEEQLDQGATYVGAILQGSDTILNQTVAPTTSDDVRQPAQLMAGYLETMRSLARQQMDSLEQFNRFSSALEANFNNSLRAYLEGATLTEEVLVQQLVEQRRVMEQTARAGVLTLTIATIASLVAAFLFAVLFSRNIVSRVRRVMDTSAALAQGDFTATVAAGGTDEIAELGTNLNTSIEQLGLVMTTVVERVATLTDTGQQLAQSSDETAQAVQDINTIVDTSREQNDDLVANVTETSAIIEEMARNIESLDGSVQQQSAVIEQSSASIEEMISSIESISNVSTRAKDQLQSLSGAADAGRSSLDQQETLVTEMSTAGKSLQEANQLIAGVAGQTNLLAMNAAIEAAHAGDAGRGFAVVADEIRKLAETTSTQSNQVKKDLSSMQQLIARLVEGSSTSSQSFGEIQTALNDVQTVFEEIFSAMEEQRTGGSEILEALSQMREMTSSVHGGSSEMKAGNDQMLEAIRNVNEISQQSRDAMRNIAAGMETIAGALANISSVSDLNRSQIEDITAATDALTLPGSTNPAGPIDPSAASDASEDPA